MADCQHSGPFETDCNFAKKDVLECWLLLWGLHLVFSDFHGVSQGGLVSSSTALRLLQSWLSEDFLPVLSFFGNLPPGGGGAETSDVPSLSHQRQRLLLASALQLIRIAMSQSSSKEAARDSLFTVLDEAVDEVCRPITKASFLPRDLMLRDLYLSTRPADRLSKSWIEHDEEKEILKTAQQFLQNDKTFLRISFPDVTLNPEAVHFKLSAIASMPQR